MPQDSKSATDSLIPQPPITPEVKAFSSRVHSLLDGTPKDEATIAKAFEGLDSVFDMIAAGLYNLASMLVGEGEESVRLVEKTVATVEVSPGGDAAQSRRNSRRALCAEAIRILEQREPGCLAAPPHAEPGGGCIEDDELESSGVSREVLEMMIAGPDRQRVRTWLASLPVQERVIFVLRAVAGLSGAETADLLARHEAGWTAEAVRGTLRQALCSLASQLLHASSAR